MGNLTTAVKNLIIINVIFFVASQYVAPQMYEWFSLFFPKNEYFGVWQIVTHMFMHGGIMHLVFNMYALWMFGQIIERTWGAKKFLIYYFVTGLGAVVLHTFVNYLQFQSITSGMSSETIKMVLNEGANIISHNKNWTDPDVGALNLLMHIPTVGASGAIFGLLLAFGMLFPNIKLQLMFLVES